MEFLVLTFVGDDRPGFLQELTEIVTRHQGTWLDSRIINLEGKFAGLVRVGVDNAHLDALVRALKEDAQGRFNLTIDHPTTPAQSKGTRWQLDVVGNDRPGILNETSRALLEHDLNVIELTSDVRPAAMSGTLLFSCSVTIEVAPSISISTLEAQLTTIAEDLSLDIRLEPVAKDESS
ncbi:MAG: ACT domain-containing protein [Gammaproteobacteria bacterium]|nr:ACT domain-containing protein [Gammaproteobacteria bacterium]